MMGATIVALHVCHRGRAALVPLERATAIADAGLDGDRHAKQGSRRQVLLIDAETLEHFGLAPGDVREQVTVRGLDLNGLRSGTRLRVGGAVLELAGPCAPCERMNEVRPGLMQAIGGRRGRFVRVMEAGSFAVGDAIEVEPGA
jgi:MOSC domain-containing protein YiiM